MTENLNPTISTETINKSEDNLQDFPWFVESVFTTLLKENSEAILQSESLNMTFLAVVKNIVNQTKPPYPQRTPDRRNKTVVLNSLDLRIKYKRKRIHDQPKGDLCQFLWFKNENELMEQLQRSFGSNVKSVLDLIFGNTRYSIRFLSPFPRKITINAKKTQNIISSKEDMVVIQAFCSSSALNSTILLFEQSNPLIIQYLKKDTQSADLFRIITHSSHSCFALINFGLFYLLKADSLQWMPNHSFKGEILFENYVRKLSPKLFSNDMSSYRDTLDYFRLDMVMKNIFNLIFPKRKESDKKPLPQLSAAKDPRYMSPLNLDNLSIMDHYLKLPSLISKYKNNNGSYYQFVLDELVRSQYFYQNQPIYFNKLVNQSATVSLYECILNYLNVPSSLSNSPMIREDALGLLYKTLQNQLKDHTQKARSQTREDNLWFNNEKYILFYRILEVLYSTRHHYYIQPKETNFEMEKDSNSNNDVKPVQGSLWVWFKVPLLEYDPRCSIYKIANLVYTTYQRFTLNQKIQKKITIKEKQQISTESSFSDESSCEENAYTPSSWSSFSPLGLPELNNNGNDLYKSVFRADVLEAGDEIIAIRNMNLAHFESFTTRGRIEFDKAIKKADELNYPLPNDKSKEELFCSHIYSEFVDMIAFYKTISDCTTSSLLAVKDDDANNNNNESQSFQPDRSRISLQHLADGIIPMNNLKTGYEDLSTPIITNNNNLSNINLMKIYNDDSYLHSNSFYHSSPNLNDIVAKTIALSEYGLSNPTLNLLPNDNQSGDLPSETLSKSQFKKPISRKRKRAYLTESENEPSLPKDYDPFSKPKKKKKKEPNNPDTFSLQMSEILIKRHWIKSNSKNININGIRTKDYTNFEMFRSSTMENRSRESLNNVSNSLNQFFLLTLYELLLSRHSPLCQEDISTILHGFSRFPEKKRLRNKQSSNKPKENMVKSITSDALEIQHKLLIRKLRMNNTNTGNFANDDSDPYIKNQLSIVSKYDGLIQFPKPNDMDFNRHYESETWFDLSDPSVIRNLIQWKEFIKMTLFYTFTKNEISSPMVDDTVSHAIFSEDYMNESIQILDSSNVELIPTLDSISCFNQPLNFIVNMDGKLREKSKDGDDVGLLVPLSFKLRVLGDDGEVEINNNDDDDDDDNDDDQVIYGYDDDDNVGEEDQILFDGEILYDSQVIYVHTTGILENSLLSIKPKIGNPKMSKWVSEFVAVDLYNIWKERYNQ